MVCCNFLPDHQDDCQGEYKDPYYKTALYGYIP